MSVALVNEAPRARFLTRPGLEPQEDDASADQRGTWLVQGALAYWSVVAFLLITVPAGFRNDLASVPRMPFAYWLTGGLGHYAAVLHDWLYTTHQIERAMADDVFYEALLVCNVPKWKARLMWAAVRAFGGSSWDAPGQEQPEEVKATIARLRPTTEL